MPRARGTSKRALGCVIEETTRKRTELPEARKGIALRFWLCAALAGCTLSNEGTGGEPNERPDPPVVGIDAGESDAQVGRNPDGLTRDAGPRQVDGSLVDARVPPGTQDAGGEPDPSDDASIGAEPDASEPTDAAEPSVDGTMPDAAPVDAGDSDASTPVDAGNANNGACQLDGTYAMRLDFDINWAGTEWNGVVPVIAPGSGQMTMWSSVLISGENKKKGEIEAVACGSRIPDFKAGENTFRGETYSVYIPESAWDSPLMPRWKVGWQATCKKPGCVFAADPLSALLGARNTPPAMPGGAPGLELADHDNDGRLAVTAVARGPSETSPSGKPYSYPPVVLPWQRARELQLAIGIYAQLQGTVTTCDALSGRVLSPVVQQGAVGCRGYVGSDPEIKECSPEFVTFIDENLPMWTVTAARFSMVRIDTRECPAVRAALP